MRIWIDRIFLAAITLIVTVLALTALPVLAGGHLEGYTLLMHMMASGMLVVALPLFSLIYLGRSISKHKSGGLQRLGFWSLVLPDCSRSRPCSSACCPCRRPSKCDC